MIRGSFRRTQKFNRTERDIGKKKNEKSRLKNAFGKKVDFLQRSDGLPEIIYGTENVPFENNTSERSDVKLVKKTVKLLYQKFLNAPDVYSS